jgi:DNA-binding NarL/FixJ family response regulator
LKVLIADDSEGIREVIRGVVESHDGWGVCGYAKDGAEAVRKSAELQPDIVLLDLAMPVLDGFHAAQQIVARNPEVIVVMVTQHCSTSLRAEALKFGIHEVINKCDAVEYLVRTIADVANAHGKGRGAIAGGWSGRVPQERDRSNP